MASVSEGRFGHLWQLAVHCAEKNPALAKFYLSEISSSAEDDTSAAFAIKYCQHCFALFTAQNCCVRLLPKRRKNKKQKQKKHNNQEEKDDQKKQGKASKLPRKLNHVNVFCKTCGKQSFCTGQPRSSSVSKTRDFSDKISYQSNNNVSVLCTPQGQGATPNLSTSGKNRKRRHNSKLKDMLLADEQHKSKSTTASPRLQDFLSSL